ncbi:peptidase M29 [Pusillimonas sp.]|uniref:peptidase M29 n=1 Tax=Pusillimonas sp. TaxID=3040095 RepID=UPI0037C697F1
MLCEVPQGKWIDGFAQALGRCGISRGTRVALLSETESRRLNIELCELALDRLGARWVSIRVPSPPQGEVIPVRSTGSSIALKDNQLAVRAISGAEVIIDGSVEGLLHSSELSEALASGARMLMISNEHPDVLERIALGPSLKDAVLSARKQLTAANTMVVESRHGTKLRVDLAEAVVGGNWGYCTEPGTRAHWPGGLVACFPRARSVSGQIVLAPGDANLTFKRYIEQPVHLTLENDYVVDIQGENLDAELMRSYLAAWQERDAYAVSHVGWGLNPAARWESLAMYDRANINGTELRVFSGNFLFSTGANEHAGRHTKGHFDIPMRGCSIYLDGNPVVVDGHLHPKTEWRHDET